MKGETRSILVLTAALLVLVQGCATLKRRDAVPASLTPQAEIPGIPNARFWVDADLTPYLQEVERALDREKAFLARSRQRSALPPANFLAISGGSDNGAFGAGLLVGWTQTGTRSEFKGAGISTGALIAPFAFLTPDGGP